YEAECLLTVTCDGRHVRSAALRSCRSASELGAGPRSVPELGVGPEVRAGTSRTDSSAPSGGVNGCLPVLLGQFAWFGRCARGGDGGGTVRVLGVCEGCDGGGTVRALGGARGVGDGVRSPSPAIAAGRNACAGRSRCPHACSSAETVPRPAQTRPRDSTHTLATIRTLPP